MLLLLLSSLLLASAAPLIEEPAANAAPVIDALLPAPKANDALPKGAEVPQVAQVVQVPQVVQAAPVIDALLPVPKANDALPKGAQVVQVPQVAQAPQVVQVPQVAQGPQIVQNPLAKGTIQGPPADKCKAIGANRQDCGFPGITADQCAIQGCCFSELEATGPYCFYSDGSPNIGQLNLNDPIKDAVCTFPDSFRVQCGEGLTELQCRNKGCCHSENSLIKCAFPHLSVSNAAIIAPQVVNNQIQQGIVIGNGQVQVQGVQGGVCTQVVAANVRVDCGFDGITENECTAKNCCFGLLPVGQVGPICYQNTAAAKGTGYKNMF